MVEAPPRPSRLSLWMEKHGRPHRMEIDYRQTGNDTAETVIIFSTLEYYKKKVEATIEVSRGEFGMYNARFENDEVYLCIDHAHILDWTDAGRQKLNAWNAYQKKEERDIADYKRLRAKFGDNV